MGIFNILGGVAGLGQSIINAVNSRNNTNRTIQANKELAQYQYSKDLEMWNRANEYNSPSSQMQRFKDAGLNPNLIYGQGNAGNTATSLPKYQAPNVRYDYDPVVNLPATLSMYQDFMVKNAQIDNLKAQKDQTQANTLIKALMAKDWHARNFFNFGNEDYSGYYADPGQKMGYWNKLNIEKGKSVMQDYQLDIGRKTLDDVIQKIRLENQSKGLHNELLKKDINWYTGKQISSMVTRALGAVGFGSAMGALARKSPVINKTFYKVSGNTGEIY